MLIVIKIIDIPYIFVEDYVSLLLRLKVVVDCSEYSILNTKYIFIKGILPNKDFDGINLVIRVNLNNNDFSIYIINRSTRETIYQLKPEVGYEIINKLKEIFGDDLYE